MTSNLHPRKVNDDTTSNNTHSLANTSTTVFKSAQFPSLDHSKIPTFVSLSTRPRSHSARAIYTVGSGHDIEVHAPPLIAPREVSPDRNSRASTASSLTASAARPLRKKPKSLQITNDSIGAKSDSSKALGSGDSVLPRTTNEKIVTIPDSPSALLRSNTVPSLPVTKRAPASHSSYGVGTSSGPPPSYSTQRTFSQDRIWKADRASKSRMNINQERGLTDIQNQSSIAAISTDTTNLQSGSHHPPQTDSSPDTAETQSISTPTENQDMGDLDVRGAKGLGIDPIDEDNKDASSDERKSEDLFLNIAKIDASRSSQPTTSRRRSRISLPFFSTNCHATSPLVSPSVSHAESQQPTRYTNVSHQFHRRSPATQHIPNMYNQDYDERTEHDQAGLPLRPFDQESALGSTTYRQHQRRTSPLPFEAPRSSQRQISGLRANRLVSESGYMERQKSGELVATESTVSTAAPSTVWDELEDLKSRIRKLELTGKLPPSSTAAMASAERPRTATTAATTLSISPKQKFNTNTLQSTIEGIPSNIYPMLHEALGNVKGTISNDIYQKLQTTAQDAMQLAALMKNEGSSTNLGIPPSTERQIRRYTEDVCRSLTELTIALATDPKCGPPASLRPAVQDTHISPSLTSRSRRYSNEASDRLTVTSRVQSRLENRRTSLHASSPLSVQPSPDYPSRLHNQTQNSLSRIGRTSTVLHSRRISGIINGGDDADDINPRPISRAMTDNMVSRHVPRRSIGLSREQTGQYALSMQNEGGSNPQSPRPSGLNSSPLSRRQHSITGGLIGMQEDSPLRAKESWGETSITPSGIETPNTSFPSTESRRILSNRRSLGFANRLGPSVGSRLRAVKAESSGQELTPSSAYYLNDARTAGDEG